MSTDDYNFAASLDEQLITLQFNDPCPRCGTPLQAEEGSEGKYYLYCYKDGFNTL